MMTLLLTALFFDRHQLIYLYKYKKGPIKWITGLAKKIKFNCSQPSLIHKHCEFLLDVIKNCLHAGLGLETCEIVLEYVENIGEGEELSENRYSGLKQEIRHFMIQEGYCWQAVTHRLQIPQKYMQHVHEFVDYQEYKQEAYQVTPAGTANMDKTLILYATKLNYTIAKRGVKLVATEYLDSEIKITGALTVMQNGKKIKSFIIFTEQRLAKAKHYNEIKKN